MGQGGAGRGEAGRPTFSALCSRLGCGRTRSPSEVKEMGLREEERESSAVQTVSHRKPNTSHMEGC